MQFPFITTFAGNPILVYQFKRGLPLVKLLYQFNVSPMSNDALPPSRKGRSPTDSPKLGRIDTSREEPIERQVYRRLRFGLMSGLISPETTLTGRSLAHELEVSVQPVRDALKRLESDGVLESKPQSGFYLRTMTQDEFREVTEIRHNLEGLAGQRAAQTIHEPVLERLRHLNQNMQEMSASQDYLAANFKFHFTIYSSAQSPVLLQIIQNLWLRIGPILHHVQFDADVDGVAGIHDDMLDALAKRDGPAVARAISADLSGAAKLILPQLDPAPTKIDPDYDEWLLLAE
ncbi:GntR family transcriptional regulator [Mameliella alba]|nr:GntR family transcriptional regulator [Mameliella alba]